MKKLAKRYALFLLMSLLLLFMLVFFPTTGGKALFLSWSNLLEMLSVVPPIFILLGLMDVWIKRETMVKHMGEDAGIKGILLAFFIGSLAAGPLYAAFPVAGVLMKKGAKFTYVLIMLGAWSTTKLPLLLFEASSMGPRFTLVRLALDLIGIAGIAYVTNKMVSKQEQLGIYEKAARL